MQKSKISVLGIMICTVLLICSTSFSDQNLELIEAAQKGDLKRVQDLLNKGCDVETKNRDGITALMAAAFNNHLEIMKLLLEWEANVNVMANGVSLLMVSSTMGQTPVVQLLLEWEADANAKDSSGVTSLMAASYEGHFDIVKLLIENRADIHAKSKDGDTALLAATTKGHTKIMELLKAHGAKE
ncbi:ankyrin repeat domain-containing protein [Desulfomonile tiedjei]|uniref:Ankyrin repeat-containing protein n=1 Tax=Desulfomonile tiedjei (strain ATCC 49306 / DSM 6799 / DCB-1) TaxID=706587 RepID=I4C6H5_DESTA|nr:ankyrin repeat domain-containing protein [Desulfomonile tiedjei]AFM25166.1 ankyrin repeat-containing protein [Desulfomonile tiedjei DSM 6799]